MENCWGSEKRSIKRSFKRVQKVITISFIFSTIPNILALFTDKLTVGLDNTEQNVRRDFPLWKLREDEDTKAF